MKSPIAILSIFLLALGWYGCEEFTLGSNRPPRITSPNVTTAIIDLPYSYTALANDPDDDILEFAYSGLPDWLLVDGNTVHGIPESTGTYHFTITVEDTEGESDRITVTIEVTSNAGLLENIVAAVSIDSLLQTVNALSGNTILHIFDFPRPINSRVESVAGNEFAAEYLEWKLASYGLLAGRFTYSESGSNIIALQQGSTHPDSIYIIGAHYDSMVSGSSQNPQDIRFSPGADDNASGVAAVLEAARVLSQYTCRYTILYALWDEEEIGFVGSEAYAEHTLECDMKIAGVVNLDMIAYDANNDGAVVIRESLHARSAQMVDRAVGLIDQHSLSLEPIVTSAMISSDNISFDMRGYSTITFIEDIFSDYNPFAHSSDDTIDKFNNDYFNQVTKLVTAILASLAGVESEGVHESTTFWYCI